MVVQRIAWRRNGTVREQLTARGGTRAYAIVMGAQVDLVIATRLIAE